MSWIDFIFNFFLIAGGSGWLGFIIGHERGISFGRKAESAERDFDEKIKRDVIKRIKGDDHV